MGVQLNIKDEATVRLARELAGRLHQSVTETIREALEAKASAAAAEREKRLADMLALADEAYRDMPEDVKKMPFKELMDSIYDDDGLPG